MLNDPDRDSLVGDSRGTSNSVVLLLLPKAYKVVVLGEGATGLFDFRNERLLFPYQHPFWNKTQVTQATDLMVIRTCRPDFQVPFQPKSNLDTLYSVQTTVAVP
jgi:hypothetical protein